MTTLVLQGIALPAWPGKPVAARTAGGRLYAAVVARPGGRLVCSGPVAPLALDRVGWPLGTAGRQRAKQCWAWAKAGPPAVGKTDVMT
jgi:hypothetical protein